MDFQESVGTLYNVGEAVRRQCSTLTPARRPMADVLVSGPKIFVKKGVKSALMADPFISLITRYILTFYTSNES